MVLGNVSLGIVVCYVSLGMACPKSMTCGLINSHLNMRSSYVDYVSEKNGFL